MKTEYQLFICDTSKKHAPICVFVSDSPFPCFLEGQRFDDHGWRRLDGSVRGSEDKPLRFIIHSIKHVIKVEKDTNIVQTGLNLEPYNGKRSPAFDSKVEMTWSEAIKLYKKRDFENNK